MGEGRRTAGRTHGQACATRRADGARPRALRGHAVTPSRRGPGGVEAFPRTDRDPRQADRGGDCAFQSPDGSRIADAGPGGVPAPRVPAGDRRVRWRALIPGDDGSFAAITTALALTDGAADEPLGNRLVLRLGGAGSAVATRADRRLLLASDREELRGGALAIKVRRSSHRFPESQESTSTLTRRNWNRRRSYPFGESSRRLRALGSAQCSGRLRLEGDTLSFELTSSIDRPPQASAAIEPSWLDPIPVSGTIAAFAVAFEPTPEAIAAAFALADRVEKADPAHADVAPIRTRLNLLAAVARVRPDIDVWPRVKGVSGFLLADERKDIGGALIVVHMVDGESAKRMVAETIPRLLATYSKPARPDAPAQLTFQGQTINAEVIDRDVWLTWGQKLLAPPLSTPRGSRPDRRGLDCERVGKFESRNAPGPSGPDASGHSPRSGSALDRVLDEAPPVVWLGSLDGRTLVDVIQWKGLHDLVKQVLDVLPLDPPPHR